VSAAVVARLVEALGARVELDGEAREEARADRSGHAAEGRPIALVHAESIADVQAVMRIATETSTPVVARGAGTGLAGGANAGAGEIALSLRRMDRILEVRPDDLLAVVEPGILNADLNTALAAHGVWWAPDPASRDISTVGGNIATGAGGLLCEKYGVVRDAVLGVDLVLADGRLLRLGHRSVKGVTGLDLTSLVIGSEGILGIGVGATLKLRRLVPGQVRTLSAVFPGVRAAAAASSAVTASGVQPAIMELMDARSLARVHDFLGLDPMPVGAAQLIVQTDGPGASDEADTIAAVLEAAGAAVAYARDEAEGERLLAVRRAANPAWADHGRMLIEDVSVPRSALADMFDAIADIEQRYGVIIPTIAHAGDGNLHPSFVIPGTATGAAAAEEVPELIWDAASELFRAALALGGTLTGEHGVGVLKRRWLADELGEDQWELQRQIARVFDPEGLLNPGKVFAPTPVAP
jgi:glycolate oxidase